MVSPTWRARPIGDVRWFLQDLRFSCYVFWISLKLMLGWWKPSLEKIFFLFFGARGTRIFANSHGFPSMLCQLTEWHVRFVETITSRSSARSYSKQSTSVNVFFQHLVTFFCMRIARFPGFSLKVETKEIWLKKTIIKSDTNSWRSIHLKLGWFGIFDVTNFLLLSFFPLSRWNDFSNRDLQFDSEC